MNTQINLEFCAIDSQGFITNNEKDLKQLYGDKEDSCKGVLCLNEIAARVATVFASLREFPVVRYQAAKFLDATTITTFPDLIPTKLAAGIWDSLMKYKDTIPDFNEAESCELLILDRSIAPVIHEWTYDAMCHDLLNMEGNRYVLEVPSKTGGQGVLLEKHDPVWLEFHHEHIAEVSERLKKLANFVSNNKAAEMENSRDRDSHDQSTMQLKKITQALPHYLRQKERLSLHSEIAGKIYSTIRDLGLRELAQLEQALVFGYAGMEDVIKYLRTKDDTTGENKLRLLMILAAIYPEQFEGEEVHKNLIKLAKLPPCDMAAVNNIKLLGGSSENRKSSSGIFFPKFDITTNRASRKERPSEEPWQFSSFYPIIEELIEKLSKGELSKEEYPCLNDPKPTLNHLPQAHSMRSRRTPTWRSVGFLEMGFQGYISLLDLLVCVVHQRCLLGGVEQQARQVLKSGAGRCIVCRSPADLVDYEKVLKLFFVPVWRWPGKEPLMHCYNCKLFFPQNYALPPPKADSTAEELLRCRVCDRRVDAEFSFCPYCGSAM
ncbi:hypothetical protein ACLB2K_014418 [Fragaria x ananassa]